MTKTETIAFFDELSQHWNNMHCDKQHLMDHAITQLQLRAGERILDIGCGTGLLSRRMLCEQPSAIVGLDISSGMIERATRDTTDTMIAFCCGDFYLIELTPHTVIGG